MDEDEGTKEEELRAELVRVKKRLAAAQTVEERIKLRTHVGELTQRIRRLRMRESEAS
ncbi:MAG: hypothetical protein QM346_12295 [Chloroflexota bacterium]|nr:hypothetical protein [Chloroflexota bacterium]